MYQKITATVAGANICNAMETGNHSKNGASPKSLMSRGNFLLFGIIAIILLNCNTLHAQYNFAGGKGTAEEPYQIKTAEQLDSLRYFFGSANQNNHYCLMNDIDLTEFLQDNIEGWLPIGTWSKDFRGHVHGNGYKVTGLHINRPNYNDAGVGLFGLVNYTTIDNLGVEIAEGKSVEGNSNVGGLVGRFPYSSTLSSCYVNGNVKGKSSVGGLIGFTDENSIVDYCYTSGTVSGNSDVGGLIGFNAKSDVSNSYSESDVNSSGTAGGLIAFNTGSITKSFSSGAVIGAGTTGGFAGNSNGEISLCYSSGNVLKHGSVCSGFVGANIIAITTGSIKSCYSTSKVVISSTDVAIGTWEAGGITSNNAGPIEHCYATGKLSREGNIPSFRFCGISAFSTTTNIVSCYFNQETTGAICGINYHDGSGIGQCLLSGNTTAEMMQKSTFENWDFETVWDIKEGETYPFFRWETERKSLLKSITLDKGTLSPLFSPGTFEYTLSIPVGTDKVNISAAAVDGAVLSGDTGELPLSGNETTFTLKVNAENAPEHTYTITVSRAVSGINNPQVAQAECKIFPNPAKDEIFIESDLSIQKVEICSLTGSLLLLENNFNGKISVSSLPQGVYLLKVYTDKGLEISKIVKE
ncbi:MAG: T9SS type A sorting domain-containing protein [Prevotellaceae bacterium]|jgi:hypothetical protein|nr:T9SS type A sorting domain-containing protein [Prevotellaceae bacterium]